MENFITSSFYYKEKRLSFTIKIATNDTLISKIIENWRAKLKNFLFSFLKLELNNLNTEPDISLYLNRLYKKPKNLETKNSTFIFLDIIKFAPLYNNIKNKQKFILYTNKGSHIKTDIEKNTAVGRIAKGDPFALLLLYTWVRYYIVYYYLIALHAACIIYNKKSLVIFIGKNGSGKSTICNLLSSNADFKIIDDDRINIYPITKKLGIITNHRDFFIENSYLNHIFFINKNMALKTKITPITKRDAFKRIIFASEFPRNENKMQKENRLDALVSLVKQCKCYSIINGRGVKEDPASFERLLLSVIKK